MRLLLPTLIAAAIVGSSGVQPRAWADDAPTAISSRRHFSTPEELLPGGWGRPKDAPSAETQSTADPQKATTPLGPPVAQLPRQDAPASSRSASVDPTTTKSESDRNESRPEPGNPVSWIRDPIGTKIEFNPF